MCYTIKLTVRHDNEYSIYLNKERAKILLQFGNSHGANIKICTYTPELIHFERQNGVQYDYEVSVKIQNGHGINLIRCKSHFIMQKNIMVHGFPHDPEEMRLFHKIYYPLFFSEVIAEK